jgi:predicted nuclease of predicted toxin-antitoxin system
MRLLANENLPGVAVNALRSRGHDVAWVRTDAPGSSDRDVLARAEGEGRLLITFDKDFGELAFTAQLPASAGIVLFRVPPTSPREVAHIAITALESRGDWAGHFSVAEESRIRMTPLPSTSKPDQSNQSR